MPEQWTRNQIMEMGLVAMQAGVKNPEQLMDIIAKGVAVDWRIPLVRSAVEQILRAISSLENR